MWQTMTFFKTYNFVSVKGNKKNPPVLNMNVFFSLQMEGNKVMKTEKCYLKLYPLYNLNFSDYL